MAETVLAGFCRKDITPEGAIPLGGFGDDLRRCVRNENTWANRRAAILKGEGLEHTRSREYASRIMEAMITDTPYRIGGNV